jgi:hypothetical protein
MSSIFIRRCIAMFGRVARLLSLLCVGFAMGGVGGAQALGPSDCLARDADSTCNSAVSRSSGASVGSSQYLYDGPLGGVPAQGYAYWGYDFLADEMGVATVYTKDMYVNHTQYPVTIRLGFDIPTTHACNGGCLPGVQFFYGPSWASYFAAAVVSGGTVSLEFRVPAGTAYGWAIGLWEATNPRLTVTVDPGVSTTLAELGLPAQPAIALEIAAVTTSCPCIDGSSADCSLGSHFTNGLDGPWYRGTGYKFYERAGAFNSCVKQ